jgi:neurofibromin 1
MRDSHAPVAQQFSRFSNVPATLLHVGMLSLDLDNEELRAAAYDLLGAVCSYLNYDKNPIIASKGKTCFLHCHYFLSTNIITAGFIPGDLTTFIVQLSERLAEFAPELTLDFISEVSAGMEKVGEKVGEKSGEKAVEKVGEKVGEKTSTAQRINCLQYMSPWIKNLVHFPNPTSPQYEHSGARLRDCIRVLSELTVSDTEVCKFSHFS